MKQKLMKLVSIITIALILVILGGCSKKDLGTSTDKTADAIKDSNGLSEKDNETAENVTTTEDQSKDNDDSSEENTNPDVPDQSSKEDTVVPIEEVPLLEGGIKGVYEKNGLIAGTCISDLVTSIDILSDHVIENYNSVTMENDMKPDAILNKTKSIEAGDIVVEFNQRTKSLLEWSKNNNMSMRGHVLVWYSQTPQWIFYKDFDTTKELVDRDTMLARMESYIKQVFEQLDALGYLDIFYAYDVVNEAIMEDGSLRDCLWKKIIGDDYIWYAFYYADKYAPDNVKLYYNDYNEQFKTNHIVKLAQSLVDTDGRYLIDGIGCQGHLYTKDSIDSYLKTLEAFSSLGLDVQITELDVSLGTWTNILPATEENKKVQGQYYYELINRIVKGNAAGTTKVSGITFWGVTDGVSWRRDRSPLLLDKNFKPKYAYFGAVLDKDHAGY